MGGIQFPNNHEEIIIFLLTFGLIFLGDAALAQTDALVVSPKGPYTEIAAALEAASDGDTIEVQGGIYPGPLVVEKSVTLRGLNWPVIDGGDRGTVVQLNAEGIIFQGFIIRNSGSVLDEENSGIAAEAANLVIENNQLINTLFGIYLREAHGTVIRGNTISSKDLDVPRRGDPVRVWYSNGVTLENNQISKGRDVVLWYSENLTVKDNQISDGRYGLHFMYCDDALIQGNSLLNNSVGAFLMYSRRMNMTLNTIAYNRGPSGYGIGLKDMDDAVVQDNLFLDNRIGAHMDNSPREVDSVGIFDGNIFAYNDIGVEMMPSTRNNQFTRNSFVDNQEQVAVAGGGVLKGNVWTVGGEGNYWSDYAGYDQLNDGWGDEPYRSDRLFENLMDRYPELRMFVYSPSAQAVDFAAKAVPLVKPQPKLIDDAPRMSPLIPENLPPLVQSNSGWSGWSSLALLILGPFLLALPGWLAAKKILPRIAAENGGAGVVQVQNLEKRYGKVVAVDDFSVEIPLGQAVALWGPNGAGKTTILRSLLGVIPFLGSIRLAGYDVSKQGKAARALIGFVPQELNFHDDLTILETIQFYARLKKIDPVDRDGEGETVLTEPIRALLKRMELSAQLEKRVGDLSGGMKQRVALSVALLSDPPILMLDEPTSNLDVHGRDDLLDLLEGLKADGKTLIFSSHRFDEITRLADRVLVIESGRLRADTTPDQMSDLAGWRASIRLSVPSERVEAALQVLDLAGYKASPNGQGVWVRVDPSQKGLPIAALIRAGIPVDNFDFDPEGETKDD